MYLTEGYDILADIFCDLARQILKVLVNYAFKRELQRIIRIIIIIYWDPILCQALNLVVYTCLRFFFLFFTIPVWGIEYQAVQFCDPSERRNAQNKNQVLPDFCLGEFSGHRTWVQGENRSTGKLRSQRCESGLTEVSRICARGQLRERSNAGRSAETCLWFSSGPRCVLGCARAGQSHWGLTESRWGTTEIWMWLSEITHSQSCWNAGSSKVEKCHKVQWTFK